MPLCTDTPHAPSPARACSSYSTASCAKEPPPPPYSSGMDNASRPTSPALFHSSRSTCLAWIQRSWLGVSSFWQNVLARSRKSSRSLSLHELFWICSGTTGPPDHQELENIPDSM